MELGAGLALHEAWRTAPDHSEDWKKLRADLVLARQGMAEIARQATMLRNEPGIFAARFWRDFYRGLLTKGARSAMTKLVLFFAPSLAHAEVHNRLNLIVALDLSRSIAVAGSDGKSEFGKNIDGVTKILGAAPAGTRITVIGITGHRFTAPYILLRAHVPDNPGYFGERLDAARRKIVAAWKTRSARLGATFAGTDIFGALALASQILANQPGMSPKALVLSSDMRENTSELDLESSPTSPVVRRAAKAMRSAARFVRRPGLHPRRRWCGQIPGVLEKPQRLLAGLSWPYGCRASTVLRSAGASGRLVVRGKMTATDWNQWCNFRRLGLQKRGVCKL